MFQFYLFDVIFDLTTRTNKIAIFSFHLIQTIIRTDRGIQSQPTTTHFINIYLFFEFNYNNFIKINALNSRLEEMDKKD